MLPALVGAAGGVTVSVAHARDDHAVIRDAIAAALDCADVVAITGRNVGRRARPRRRRARGARRGDPLRLRRPAARKADDVRLTRGQTLVFGLPGNPVSSLVTFVLFARPALLALAGEAPEHVRTTAALAESCERLTTRLQAVRCRLELREDGWHAHATGPQSSHILTSMVGADALALIGAGEGFAPAGERVTVELL